MLSRVSGYVSDRLSSLPDDVIHKILSSMNIRDVIKTSVLSSRWRYIWTSMPHLDFSLTPAEIVANVLSNVMSHRDNLAQLSSLIISPCKPDFVFVERILKYAFGKNVQKLILISSFPSYDLTIPVSLFKSKSLKSLSLGVCIIRFNLPESTWELSALTALHLYDVTFHNDNTDHISSIDLFSKCVNLKKLSLICCTMRGAKGFRISNTCLSDLTIDDYQGELFRHLELCVNSLPSLKKLFLSVNHLLIEVDGSKMFGLLQQLHGVKFLTLNFELAKVYLCICASYVYSSIVSFFL